MPYIEPLSPLHSWPECCLQPSSVPISVLSCESKGGKQDWVGLLSIPKIPRSHQNNQIPKSEKIGRARLMFPCWIEFSVKALLALPWKQGICRQQFNMYYILGKSWEAERSYRPEPQFIPIGSCSHVPVVMTETQYFSSLVWRLHCSNRNGWEAALVLQNVWVPSGLFHYRITAPGCYT